MTLFLSFGPGHPAPPSCPRQRFFGHPPALNGKFCLSTYKGRRSHHKHTCESAAYSRASGSARRLPAVFFCRAKACGCSHCRVRSLAITTVYSQSLLLLGWLAGLRALNIAVSGVDENVARERREAQQERANQGERRGERAIFSQRKQVGGHRVKFPLLPHFFHSCRLLRCYCYNGAAVARSGTRLSGPA